MDKDQSLFNRIHRLMQHRITQKAAELINTILESDQLDAESTADRGTVPAAREAKCL